MVQFGGAPKIMRRFPILILVVFVYFVYVTVESVCPKTCTCKKINENTNSLRVKCGGNDNKIASIKELDFGSDFINIAFLNLRSNQITHIEASDFNNYTNLKTLNLSSNSIKTIDESTFGEIQSLEKLILSTNLIVHIFQGSFEKLLSLKELDISDNPLACDCNLLWLVKWSSNFSVKLKSSPKCETPSAFKGFNLKKLRVGSDFHCESPLQPLLELKPDQNQIVFEGDRLILRCRAPRVAVGAPRDSEDLPARAHVFWGWSEKIVEENSTEDITYLDPAIKFPSINIDDKHLSDSGFLDSILIIPSVTQNHTGMWDCRLKSQQAALSRSISVVVISNTTMYCPAKIVHNNKGRYFWPRTVRDRTVKLPCAGEVSMNTYVSYKCNRNGIWENLETDLCPYISETSRILEQFAKVNLSIAPGSVRESAKRLKNFTQSKENLYKIRDPVDIGFISSTLTNYLSFLGQDKIRKDTDGREQERLGSMILDIISRVMVLPNSLIEDAQKQNNATTKFINAAEQAAEFLESSMTHKTNLAIEYFNRTESFSSITCTWFRMNSDDSKRIFQCNTAKLTQSIGVHEKNIEASIQIPSSLIQPQLIANQQLAHKLVVGVFHSSKFFPPSSKQQDFLVTSAIIGVQLLPKSSLIDLSEPISIVLRARPFHNDISAPIPVWWDTDDSQWSNEACNRSYFMHGLLVFTCTRPGYYGLMQKQQYLNDFADENTGARFRFSPPAFYIGGIILFICAWINIITYLAHGNAIQMARRQRHSLVNTWIALSLLEFVFTVGIYQTEDYRLCQVFGVLIHYLSISVILWICVSVSNMYKRLSKKNRLPIDDLPRENIGRKPILGLYLVGWGIGLIICGISGAVNMREYASYSHCFLRTGPALSAIFVPAAILILFLMILFICVRCHIRRFDDQNGHLSEGTQATENVDLELLDSTPNGNAANRSERYRSLTLSSPTTSMQEDLEHSNVSQLRAHIIFLFLYVLTWLAAAVSIITPYSEKIDYEETIFSVVYAVSASILGVFIIFFYCISRSDVRAQWALLSCRNICISNCHRSRGISDTIEINTVAYHQTNSTMNSNSRSNSQCSKTRTPSATNNLKHAELNSAAAVIRTDSPNKGMPSSANMNIVLVNRQQFVHNPLIVSQEIPNPEIFYNPNQINVARKFFKKQKRLAKRNNFELQRQIERGDFGDGASDISSSVGSFPRTRGISIFSSGSKVNNTNIHVRNFPQSSSQFSKESRPLNMNPNILSDSCNESDLIVDAERLVLGAEGLRVLSTRNKVNNTEMVANIYTNVPETSQPQHEIVTMRADDKFRKSLNVGDLLEQDEIDQERNDLNSQSDRTSTPMYVNGNFRNIMDEKEDSTNAKDDNLNTSDPLLLSLDSPIIAMNTIGLPIDDSNIPLAQRNDNVELMSISNDENMLELDKNEAYISEPLEISDRPYNCTSQAHAVENRPQKAKSLVYLDGETKKPNKKFNSFHESQVRSVSCNNLSQLSDTFLGTVVNPVPGRNLPEKRLLSSPVLFSPSLCEIDDIQSPQDHRGRTQTRNKCSQDSMMGNDNGSVGGGGNRSSSDTNLSFDRNSLNLFSQSIRRNFASSPTCESDLNYQNSELSIRSHGVYAPQPDNDLNMTLTGEDSLYFPYQSSEISDLDDENDFEDFNNCSNDFLLPKDECHDLDGSQSSIDELYQQITRRSIRNAPRSAGSGASAADGIGCDGTNVEDSDIIQQESSSMIVEPNSNFNNDGHFVGVENDDDSSQCSIISYIDPNECTRS